MELKRRNRVSAEFSIFYDRYYLSVIDILYDYQFYAISQSAIDVNLPKLQLKILALQILQLLQ